MHFRMSGISLISFVYFSISYSIAQDINVQRTLRFIPVRRLNRDSGRIILGVPIDPEDLPEAESILPGHTLLRPSLGMLKSAIKFPHGHNNGALVYGNPEHIGLKNNRGEYIRYTDFRRSDGAIGTLLNQIADAVKRVDNSIPGRANSKILVYFMQKDKTNDPKIKLKTRDISNSTSSSLEEDVNQAGEILDSSIEEIGDDRDGRRRKKRKMPRDIKGYYDSTKETDSESSDSRDYEKNPGNPYTVHKNRYKQNWMWNHFMDGDHMNVNPFAPSFQAGPTGADLFFARKWWYYNQDDFVPFR